MPTLDSRSVRDRLVGHLKQKDPEIELQQQGQNKCTRNHQKSEHRRNSPEITGNHLEICQTRPPHHHSPRTSSRWATPEPTTGPREDSGGRSFRSADGRRSAMKPCGRGGLSANVFEEISSSCGCSRSPTYQNKPFLLLDISIRKYQQSEESEEVSLTRGTASPCTRRPSVAYLSRLCFFLSHISCRARTCF